jgi:hypothetical protein
MEDIKKSFTVTLGVFMFMIVVSVGWNIYEHKKREAEIAQYCQTLKNYLSAVKGRGNQASYLERSAAQRAKAFSHLQNCN